jgi:hypothetical protein
MACMPITKNHLQAILLWFYNNVFDVFVQSLDWFRTKLEGTVTVSAVLTSPALRSTSPVRPATLGTSTSTT